MRPTDATARRRHARWMLGSGATQALVALGSNLALMRLLAPEEFGRFALALAAVALVFSVLSLRLGPVVQRASDELLASGFGALAAGAILAESAFAALVSLGLLALGGRLDALALALTASVMAMHALSQLRGFVERGSPYGPLARIEGSAHLLGHGTALAAAGAGLGPWALAAREGVLVAVQALGLAALLAERPELRPARPRLPRLRDWPTLARRASDSTLDGLLEGLVARCSVLGAGLLGGAAGAGLLAQAQRLAMVPHQFLGPLCGRLAFQWFAEAESPAERDAIQRRVLRRLAPFLIAAGVGTLALAPTVVPLLFGARWEPAAGLLLGLVGVACGASPLALVRMRLLAERRLGGLLAQRATQLGCLAGGLGLAAAWPAAPLLGLCLGLSAGTLAAALVGLRFQRRAPTPVPAADAPEPAPNAAEGAGLRRSA